MSNPVMERIRRGLAAGAARAEAEASAAETRLGAAGGVGENELVRLQVDAVGRLVRVQFTPVIATATPAGWAGAVRVAYDTACDQIGPMSPGPEVSGADPQAVHRPGTSRDGQVERARELATSLPELVVESEQGGVRISLTGLQQLAGAGVTPEALLGGAAAMEESFHAAWRDAAGQVEARVRKTLAGTEPAGGSR